MVIRLVSQGKLLLKYSLLWLVLGIVALIIALFPSVAGSISHALGFGLTSNFVFFVVLALLGVICMALTVIVSWQARDIRSLIQQMALLRQQQAARRGWRLKVTPPCTITAPTRPLIYVVQQNLPATR